MVRQAGGLIDINDMPADGDWQDLPTAVGITSNPTFPVEYLRMSFGRFVLVALRGRVSGVVAATDTGVGTLPSNCLPDVGVYDLGIVAMSSSVKGRVWVSNSVAGPNVFCRADSGTNGFIYGIFVAAFQ